MAEFAAIPLFTDAWIADTSHLTRAERGLYMDLLILIWRSPECRVPNDIAWIARRLRVGEEELPTLQALAAEFLKSSGNFLTQKRLRREWDYTFEKRKKNTASAKSRWRKEKIPCERSATDEGAGNANAMPPHPHPHPQYSEGKPSAADAAEVDPVRVMFDAGLGLLGASGMAEARGRELLGRWRKAHGTEAVIAALGRAQREGAVDPVSFIEGVLKWQAKAKSEAAVGEIRRGQDGIAREYQGDGKWIEVLGG